MNTNIKTAAKLAAFAGAFALTGCAFVPYDVHPTYNPPANVTKVPGANKVVVNVVVKNEKKHHDQVSYVINGYGFDTAPVSMHVTNDFKDAIDAALKSRGYKVSASGGTKLVVIVKKYFFTPIGGLVSESEKGSTVLVVSVIDAKGRDIYSTKIKQRYKENDMIFQHHEETAKRLMDEAINKLFSDQKFLAALTKTKDVTVPRIAIR